MQLVSGERITLKAGQDLELVAEDGQSVTVRGDGHIDVKDGELLVDVAGDLFIEGDGRGELIFEQAGGGVRISPRGEVSVYGHRVGLEAAEAIEFRGPVEKIITAPTLPEAAGPPAVEEVEDIGFLEPEKARPRTAGHWVGLMVRDALDRPVAGVPYQLKGADGTLVDGGILPAGGGVRQPLPWGEDVEVDFYPEVGLEEARRDVERARRALAEALDAVYRVAEAEARIYRRELEKFSPVEQVLIHIGAVMKGAVDGVTLELPELPDEVWEALKAMWEALKNADLAGFEEAVDRIVAAGVAASADAIDALRQLLYDVESRQLLYDFVERYARDCIKGVDIGYSIGYALSSVGATIILTAIGALIFGVGAVVGLAYWAAKLGALMGKVLS
ncbi:MAG TPA: hypothetical protein EYP33_00345, partial [Pyrodictium sp.]|nr:hypothetical protein [Pyrodictium sp.]